jgi:hypothetical protein
MRQIDLFSAPAGGQLEAELALDDQALQSWRLRVLAYQQPLRRGTPASAGQQANLFEAESENFHIPPDPLTLPAQHLQFWRWPEALNQGAALYYVFDHGLGPDRELLLYLGETSQADRRWKGDHDCKDYLAAYGEALVRCGLLPRFSIRFWCDAPAKTRARRRLEQQQIRHWQPPFNKECRQRWQTPFQNQPH